MLPRSLHPMLAVLAGSLSEAEASRRVWLAAGGLALLGVVLTICTVFWWRSTKVEHPSLAPLEVMSARRWLRSSDTERTRLVDRVRPQGSDGGDSGRAEPEPVDLSVLAAGDHAGFDDLREIDEMLGLDLAAISAKDHADADQAAADAADAAVAQAEADEAAAAPRILPRADAPDDEALPATPAPTLDPSADLDALLRSFGASSDVAPTIEPPEWLRRESDPPTD